MSKMTPEELTVDSLAEMMWETWKRDQPTKDALLRKWNARRKNTVIGIGIRSIARMVWPLVSDTREAVKQWKNLYDESRNEWARTSNALQDTERLLTGRTKELDSSARQLVEATAVCKRLQKDNELLVSAQLALRKELEVANDALVESRKNTDRCTVKLCQLIDVLDRITDNV